MGQSGHLEKQNRQESSANFRKLLEIPVLLTLFALVFGYCEPLFLILIVLWRMVLDCTTIVGSCLVGPEDGR